MHTTTHETEVCCPRCGYHDIENAWNTDYICNDCHYAWNHGDVPVCVPVPLQQEES